MVVEERKTETKATLVWGRSLQAVIRQRIFMGGAMDDLAQLFAKLSIREQEFAAENAQARDVVPITSCPSDRTSSSSSSYESSEATSSDELDRPVPVKRNPMVIGVSSRDRPVNLFKLGPTGTEFKKVLDQFGNFDRFQIDAIYRVDNPYLKRAFMLKLEEERGKAGNAAIAQPVLLFHGTNEAAVSNICMFNFDRRMVKRCRYGKGVSFATDSAYAADYSDPTALLKLMMVAWVTNTPACFGKWGAKLPPPEFDCTRNKDGTVIVKYDDCDFFPAYVIYYYVLPNAVAGKEKKSSQK